MIKKAIYIIFILPIFSFASAENIPAKIEVCFTPSGNCTAKIVSEIDKAQKDLLIQAYNFTSVPISRALGDAKKRGIKIKILLDKSQVKGRNSVLPYLKEHNIETKIDYLLRIAHNKIIIIDSKEVITGSFNFTEAAQYKNAENVLIIQDTTLAKQYINNWLSREKVSMTTGDYIASRRLH